MKKCISFVLFIFMLFGCCIKTENIIFACDGVHNYELSIVVKNFDNLSSEYQKLFLDIDLPILLESKERFGKNTRIQNKQFIAKFDEKDIKTYIISNQNPQKMRNIIYNAISFAKDNDKCYLVFNLNNETEENGYFALIDTMELFYNMGIHITYFN